MLSNIITLHDLAAVDPVIHSYDLVSRLGMSSLRRETTVGSVSSDQSALTIKNTVDMQSPKPNRHLIKLSRSFEVNATTGERQDVSVHVVITRGKSVSDDQVLLMCNQLASFMTEESGSGSLILPVLLGGN